MHTLTVIHKLTYPSARRRQSAFIEPYGKTAQGSWRSAEASAPHPESAPQNQDQSYHSVQEYQMELMLLEYQKKKRAMMNPRMSDTAEPGSI